MLKFLLRLGCLVTLLCISISSISYADTPVAQLPPHLIISEVQTGGLATNGTEDGSMEFVELYNPLDTPLQLSGWQLQYLKADYDYLAATTPTRLLAELSGEVAPESYVLITYKNYLPDIADNYFIENSTTGSLAKTGGSVRLVDDSGEIVDWVGWGTAKIPSEWSMTSALAAGYSIKRIFPDDPLFGVATFSVPTLPAVPTGGGFTAVAPEEETPPEDTPPPAMTCEDVIINELLPNPGGADSGHEFIELYNPTNEVIELTGCGLQTSANSKVFIFGQHSMEPGSYTAVSDTETGLTLPNSSGGTVWLLTPANVELQAVTYPGSLEDDVAWASFLEGWQQTYQPTKNAENILLSIKPCPAGQERSQETGRCKTIAATATMATPCKPGQERNPETNRCRSVLAAVITLKPCAADEERNPATNRCRKIASNSHTLTPCQPGYERNPVTNRCRKAATGTTLAAVQDVQSAEQAPTTSWWITGGIVLAALGYGIYEWRQDISLRLRKAYKGT